MCHIVNRKVTIMFLEVNKLKGLIIDLGPDISIYDQWVEISNLIPCAFLYQDEEHRQTLEKIVNKNSIFNKNLYKLLAPHVSIYKALASLGLHPFEVAYITYNPNELKHILAEPIGTILINSKYEIDYDFMGYIPDFIVCSVLDIKPIIEEKNKGYFGELTSTIINRNMQPLYNSGYIIQAKLQSNISEYTVLASGRYFQPGHIKYSIHQLSKRIKRSKVDSTQNVLFSKIIAPILEHIDKNQKIDGVTRVPPRPSENDRLAPIIDMVCAKTGLMNLSSELECIKDYPKQKTLLRDQRIVNVKDKFKASPNVKNKHIILFDDVITTGATVMECADQLILAGANKVTIVVLGINQFKPVWPVPRYNIECQDTNCTGELVLKLYNNGTGAFFGCSNFRINNCTQSLDFLDGWQRKNKLNAKRMEEIVMEEIDIENDFSF